MDYIARRPRAERFGAHGLFTGGDDPLALSRVADTVAAHPGNVWLPIISLRREDAARPGYDNAGQRKDLLTSYAPQLADAMKIPFDQFRWYAAFHNEGHHPHIHMVCYSADSKTGFLTKEGIANIKSGLAKELFRQELTAVYRRHLINAAHNLGGLRVNHPKAGIVRVLDIATGRREQRYAGIAFHFIHISIMLVFWSLLRNSVVLTVYLLFSVACFFTIQEHGERAVHHRQQQGNPRTIPHQWPAHWDISGGATFEFYNERNGNKAASSDASDGLPPSTGKVSSGFRPITRRQRLRRSREQHLSAPVPAAGAHVNHPIRGGD